MGHMKDKFGSFVKFLRSYKKTILLIAITAAAVLAISSLVSMWLGKVTNLSFPTIGTIRFEGVEGYWDKNLANRTGTDASCDWGLIIPGATKNVTLYLRSISNIETRLNRTETDWTFYNSSNEIVAGPSDSTSYLYLTWDYDNSTVQPGEVIQVTLTLHASSSSEFIEFLIAKDVKAFSFDIHISTSQPS